MSFKEHVAIRINSENRSNFSNTNANDFNYHLAQHVTLNRKRQYFARIENVHIPTSFYNINDNNNTLIIEEDNGATQVNNSITLTNGNYSATEIITEIESLLDANTNQTNDFTLTFSDITGKISMVFTGGSTQVKILSPSNGSTLNDILGFYIDGTEDTIAASVTYTGPNHVNLQAINEIQIRTSISSDNYYNSEGKEKIGLILSIDEQRGSFIKFINDQGFRSKLASYSSISQLRFKLQDSDGNLIDLNGREWNCTMVIYEYRG